MKHHLPKQTPSKTLLGLFLCCFLAAPVLAAEPMVYEQSGETQDLYLHGAKLTVTGSDNTLRVLSNCNPLVVVGDNNIIMVKAVDKIDVTGSGNQITWSAAIELDEPEVTDKGKDNTIQAGPVDAN